MKRYIAQNNIKFYTIDASKVAQEVGLGNRTNMVTQTAFWEALMLCVVPFLPGDAVKIVAAMLLSVKINKIIAR